MRWSWCDLFHERYWIMTRLVIVNNRNRWVWWECSKCARVHARRFFNNHSDRVMIETPSEKYYL